MTDEDEAFTERVQKMVDRANGMRPLATQLGVTNTGIRAWLAGSKPFDSTLLRVQETSGVSALWIRDGVGDEETELAKISPLPPRGSREMLHEGFNEDARAGEIAGPRGALKRALDEHHMTAADLAKEMKYPIGPIQALLERGSRITQPMAERIAKILPELDLEFLMGGSDTPRIVDEAGVYATHGSRPNISTPKGMRARVIPFISFAQAGASVNYEDDTYTHEGVTVFNVKDPNAYATQIRGDSMEPRIKEGDILIVVPNAQARNGDVVIARLIDGDVMCKIYGTKDGGRVVMLSSYNPAHPTIEVTRDQIDRIQPVQSVMSNLRKD